MQVQGDRECLRHLKSCVQCKSYHWNASNSANWTKVTQSQDW